MVRSMYSGVAGMRTHQTRMDVIGNNISNVNTYGFKSSRATFRDVYYQATKNASAASGTKGGINPSMVGYGAQIASIDVLQTQSTLTNTGNPLDVAIMGDGFLQVQDADGNIFYTKAGMLDIDSMGNLVDLNGNFVLGVSGNPIGKDAGSNRIQLSIPAVNPAPPSFTDTINDIQYTISGSNNTEDGNVVFNFVTASDLPLGQKMEAILTSSGVTIRVNPTETFATMSAFVTEMNAAITRANGGAEHPAGTFSIDMAPSTKFVNLTGEEIVGSNFGIKPGTITLPTTGFITGMKLDSVGDAFNASADTTNFSIKRNAPTADAAESFELTVTVGSATYTATVLASDLKAARKVLLTNAANPEDQSDSITLSLPSYGTILDSLVDMTDTMVYDEQTFGGKEYLLPSGYKVGDTGPKIDASGNLTAKPKGTFDGTTLTAAGGAATPSAPSNDLGLGSKAMLLDGGTVGGPQTVKDLTGISIGADGVIVATHAVHGQLELGRIDLATFENMEGLEQSGNTYFTVSKNSGAATVVKAGTHGTGGLKSNSLEQSNVDLSQEFSDMITTQRGFQANSRLITVSDTMLEELINLKR
ncbi:MAG: flagellar hook-basal body complex protein [Provencibacterium sp.]|nr:flagellar hook-basal body complex protein [Provencibacterium sp.]